ncbi:MAG: T9SS type A sorting domain-containing protein [candidate division WOR-3 bacterium]|nr:T9SS type A sorting domain-containing protein [candidate division WOR-3 bacterium]
MKAQLTVLTALAALLLPLPLKAQITFERTYGGTDNDGAQAVVQTTDGGYYVVGYTYSTGSGGADVFVIATDPSGEERWTQTFGGAQDDYGYGVAMTAHGDCLAAGYLMMLGRADVALHGNTADGEQLWIQVYGGSNDDMAYSIARNSDGGFIVAGATYSFGSGVPNAYVLRTDSLGDTLWTRTYGGAGEDYAFSARQTADSGFIICGTTYSYGAGQSDIYLVKTNAAGDTQWTRTYGGAEHEHGHSILQTADSGYLICGTTYSFGAGDADIWLIRTDANGDTLWTRTFGGDSSDLGHSVAQTADHGFILCGQTSSFGAGSYDAWLIKTDSAGDTLWTRTFGGAGDDRGYSVQQTADGGFVMAGYTSSSGAGEGDFYLVKTNSSGNVAVAEPKTSPPRASALSLSCEPNPCRGATTVRTSYIVPRSSLSVYDAQGRMVLTREVSTSPFPLSTSDLPPGAYFARLDAGGQHATARLVLQR